MQVTCTQVTARRQQTGDDGGLGPGRDEQAGIPRSTFSRRQTNLDLQVAEGSLGRIEKNEKASEGEKCLKETQKMAVMVS